MMNSTIRFVLLAAAISGVVARSNVVRSEILVPDSNPEFARALNAPLVQIPVPDTLDHIIPVPDGQRRHLFAESRCILYRKCVTYGPTERQPNGHHIDSWVCKLSREDSNVTNGVQFVDIVESTSIRDTIANSTSGATVMTMSEAIIDAEEPRMYIPDHAKVHIHDDVTGTDRIRPGEQETDRDRGLVDHGDRNLIADTSVISNNRRMSQTTGTLRTLVIRLVDRNGRAPTDSASDMVDKVFADDINLKTQMTACSYGKLNIEAFHGNTPNNVYINNGVVDVNFDYDMNDGGNGNDQLAMAAANAQLGSLDDPMFDLVMFCFPAGGDFIAFAYPNSKYSFYSNEWCGFVGAQMHEVGHNINLAHSGEPDQGVYADSTVYMEYGDSTGYMGGGSIPGDYKRCYNPQKSYQLGWYDDQVSTINPLDGQGRREYTLNGVVDYGRNSDNLIVLRLRQTSLDQDYYIGYNKATGMNQDSDEDQDSVTVIRKEYGAPDQYGQSTKVAGLSPGQRVLITDYNGIIGRTVQVAFTGITEEGDAHVVVMEGDSEATPESDNCQPFTVEVVTDTYPKDNHWYFSDTGGYGYVAAISVPFTSENTEYRQEVCLPRGSEDRTWRFSIHDAYGDGITGNGGYRVFDQNNQQLFEGGDDFSDGKWNYKYVEVSGDPNIQPTPPPTRNPTSAPTATPACREYTVEVRTDTYPEDSSWKFVKRDDLGDEIVHAQSPVYTAKSTSTFVDVCIHQGTEYEFQFFDSYEDGLCCGSSDENRGYYKVTDKCSGDVLIDSGEVDEDFKEQIHTINVPNTACYNDAPNNHGPSPTAPPTSSPTKKKCKNSTKKKFKLKKGGKRRTCKSWAKKNKCDVRIEGGKYDGKLVEEVCEKSCKAC